MPRYPAPISCYEFTFADGDTEFIGYYADEPLLLHSAFVLKLGGAGGAGDAVALTIGGTACATSSLNGLNAGDFSNATSALVVEIGAGQEIRCTPTVGAGNSAARVFVNVIPA